MKGKRAYLIGILLFLAGAVIVLYPNIHTSIRENKNQQIIKQFEKNRKQTMSADYKKMVQYNQTLQQKGQAKLHDAWNTKTDKKSNKVIGVVKIPKMHLEAPLYYGASEENLKKGVAVLEYTSMPIGGIDTNCVIAGHRGGYQGEAMLKEIELLEKGDHIYLVNQWETLVYGVKEIEIIDPDEIEKVMIQKGKDMITLITCHPYPSNKQRYIVYAERKKQDEHIETIKKAKQDSASEKRIKNEEILNKVCIYSIGIICIIGVMSVLRKRK